MSKARSPFSWYLRHPAPSVHVIDANEQEPLNLHCASPLLVLCEGIAEVACMEAERRKPRRIPESLLDELSEWM